MQQVAPPKKNGMILALVGLGALVAIAGAVTLAVLLSKKKSSSSSSAAASSGAASSSPAGASSTPPLGSTPVATTLDLVNATTYSIKDNANNYIRSGCNGCIQGCLNGLNATSVVAQSKFRTYAVSGNSVSFNSGTMSGSIGWGATGVGGCSGGLMCCFDNPASAGQAVTVTKYNNDKYTISVVYNGSTYYLTATGTGYCLLPNASMTNSAIYFTIAANPN